MAIPVWLDALIELSDFSGDTEAWLAKLYEVFTADFITTPATFNGSPVIFDARITDQNRVECFWHITSTEDRTQGRLPDMRRSERIGWIKPIIDHSTDQEVTMWQNIRKGQLRTILFLVESNFMVVLSHKKNKYFLTTAYYVEHASRKAKLLKEHQKYVQNGRKPVIT